MNEKSNKSPLSTNTLKNEVLPYFKNMMKAVEYIEKANNFLSIEPNSEQQITAAKDCLKFNLAKFFEAAWYIDKILNDETYLIHTDNILDAFPWENFKKIRTQFSHASHKITDEDCAIIKESVLAMKKELEKANEEIQKKLDDKRFKGETKVIDITQINTLAERYNTQMKESKKSNMNLNSQEKEIKNIQTRINALNLIKSEFGKIESFIKLFENSNNSDEKTMCMYGCRMALLSIGFLIKDKVKLDKNVIIFENINNSLFHELKNDLMHQNKNINNVSIEKTCQQLIKSSLKNVNNILNEQKKELSNLQSLKIEPMKPENKLEQKPPIEIISSTPQTNLTQNIKQDKITMTNTPIKTQTNKPIATKTNKPIKPISAFSDAIDEEEKEEKNPTKRKLEDKTTSDDKIKSQKIDNKGYASKNINLLGKINQTTGKTKEWDYMGHQKNDKSSSMNVTNSEEEKDAPKSNNSLMQFMKK